METSKYSSGGYATLLLIFQTPEIANAEEMIFFFSYLYTYVLSWISDFALVQPLRSHELYSRFLVGINIPQTYQKMK